MAKVIVLSGPGGVGKNTVIELLLQKHPELKKVVTATDRPPRPGEREGFDHYFIEHAEFMRKFEAGEFAECVLFQRHHYGVLKSSLESDSPVILEININGALAIKKSKPEALLIFITPPAMADLEQRMRDRGESEEYIKERMRIAATEMQFQEYFDHVIENPNGQPEVAAEEIYRIIKNS